MDFSGCHFEYSGISSRQYGLLFANVNTSQLTSLSGSVETNYVYNKRNNKRYFIGDNFEESPIQFDAEIVTDDDRVIRTHERRNIEKWLFHQPGYNKLYVDILDDVHAETFELIDGVQKRLYLNCRFINPEKIEDGAGIRGYKFTVECDSLMAWQDTITSTYPLSHDSESSNSVITVKTDSDLNDYIYPKVTITIGSSGGDITISNNTDNESRLTSFEGLTSNIELIMDGEFNYVSGQNFEKFSDRNFIRLLDGENKINVVGDITSITFEWNNRRYL